jgi:DNA-binding transcriptional MocR family regulator
MKRSGSAEHKYLQVAEGLEKMIANEVLKIGDKLPSVRVLSDEYGISMGTAFQAYYHLEGRGLIESRPKSGYYVRFSHRRYPDLPSRTETNPVSHNVSVKEMINSVYSDIASRVSINLAIASPDPSLLPIAKLNKSVVNVLRSNPEESVMYAQTNGEKELRAQLAKLAFNWGGRFTADDVIVTNGCLEAIVVCLRAITRPGDTVAVESPTYFGINQTIESMGLKVVDIQSDPITGVDLDHFEKVIRKNKIKASVLVTSFNNPFGSCMPDENRMKLVDLITRYKIPLIEDDIYGELYFGKQRPKPCKYFDHEGLVMYCSSFSKSLAPGYRMGWILPGKFLEEVKLTKRITNISSPSLTQLAMADFLQKGRFEYHLKNLRRSLHTQCLRYIQGIIDYFPADTKVSRPVGGCLLWLELNKKINGFELRNLAMRQGISIAPGMIFSSGNAFSNCIRISFGKPWSEEIGDGIRTLGKLASQLISKR